MDPPAPASCGGETIVGEGIEFVAVGHDFGEFCPAGFEAAQEHVRWVAQAWGGEAPELIRYGLFETWEHPCWPCGEGVAGCASARIIAAKSLPHRHELAHAAHGLSCFALLEEGWAMLYGDLYQWASTEGDLLAAVDSVEGRRLPGEYYGLAARFVAFLIETRGVDSLRELCETTEPYREGFEAGLVTIYGLTLEELAAEFADYPAWTMSALLQQQACEGTDVVVSPGAWSHTLGCEGEGVEGRSGHEVWVHQLVELSGPAYWFEFEADAELMIDVDIIGCQREGMASTYQIGTFMYLDPGEPRAYFFTEFEPGTYIVRTRLDDWLEDAPHVNVSVYPL